jgi:predicted heme/steroid binding protein
MGEFGGLFGWLLILAFAGTILNYCVKFVNKKFGKQITSTPQGKSTMKLLMTIFVKNHRYFGLATILFLLAHFLIQFSRFGINVTGAIAALIMICQVGLGIYGNKKKKSRNSVWFVAHRVIAVLIILGIGLHLLIPNALNVVQGKESTNSTAQAVDTSNLPSFTLEELAKYNGQNGEKAYVAYQGNVYDVTNNEKWKNGKHNGQVAGTDLTDAISSSPHGDSVFADLDVVGTLSN